MKHKGFRKTCEFSFPEMSSSTSPFSKITSISPAKHAKNKHSILIPAPSTKKKTSSNSSSSSKNNTPSKTSSSQKSTKSNANSTTSTPTKSNQNKSPSSPIKTPTSANSHEDSISKTNNSHFIFTPMSGKQTSQSESSQNTTDELNSQVSKQSTQETNMNEKQTNMNENSKQQEVELKLREEEQQQPQPKFKTPQSIKKKKAIQTTPEIAAFLSAKKEERPHDAILELDRRQTPSKVDLTPSARNNLDELQQTRSGRRVLPPLAYWRGQTVKRDFYGNTIDMTEGSDELTGKAPQRKIIEMEQTIESRRLKGKLTKQEKEMMAEIEEEVKKTQQEIEEKDQDHFKTVKPETNSQSRKRKRNVSSDWTTEELDLLDEAFDYLAADTPRYWHEMSVIVGTKDPTQCREQIFAQLTQPTKKRKTNENTKATSSIPSSPFDTISKSGNKKSKGSSFQDKEKIRQVIELAQKSAPENDPIESTTLADLPITVEDEDDEIFDAEDRQKTDQAEKAKQKAELAKEKKEAKGKTNTKQSKAKKIKDLDETETDLGMEESFGPSLLTPIANRRKTDQFISKFQKQTQKRKAAAAKGKSQSPKKTVVPTATFQDSSDNDQTEIDSETQFRNFEIEEENDDDEDEIEEEKAEVSLTRKTRTSPRRAKPIEEQVEDSEEL